MPYTIDYSNVTYAVPTVNDVILVKKDKMYCLLDTRIPVSDSLGYMNIVRVNNSTLLNSIKKMGLELNAETFYNEWYKVFGDERSVVGSGLGIAREIHRSTGKNIPLFKGLVHTIESIMAETLNELPDNPHANTINRLFKSKVNSEEFKAYNCSESKMIFFKMCDKFRADYAQGETLWNEMISNKVRQEETPMLGKLDFENILDEGETAESYIAYQKASDPEGFGIYFSTMGGLDCAFLACAGFEFIFMREDDIALLNLQKKEAC